MSYEQPAPEILFGEDKAGQLFGQNEHCLFCERIHRPGWYFADCLNLQFDAMMRSGAGP